MIAAIFTALLLGLAGSSHCVGMCGGISCALGLAGKPNAFTAVLYQLGRVLSYGLIALLFGTAVMQLQASAPQLTVWFRSAAGVLLIMMALYTLRWWQGIGVLETVGGKLWRPIQRAVFPLLPTNAYARALTMGLVWGWLPCALVYSTLAWAVTQSSSALEAASLMLAFGLGTAPAMLAAGVFAQQLKKLQQQLHFRRALGVLLLIMGAWTLWGVWQHLNGHHAHHASHKQMDHAQMEHAHLSQPHLDPQTQQQSEHHSDHHNEHGADQYTDQHDAHQAHAAHEEKATEQQPAGNADHQQLPTIDHADHAAVNVDKTSVAPASANSAHEQEHSHHH